MKYIFKKKPFFNKRGDWHIPSSVPFGGELDPTLTPKEWLAWLLSNSDNAPDKLWSKFVGSRTTIWRIKKKLKEKGHL